MSYWRSLLFLIALPFLSNGANIQGIPTPTIFVGAGSSYDGMSKYTNAAPVNGLRLFNVAHLGAKFGGAYVDRANAFGVIAFDNMVFYLNGAGVNGLNGPEGWNGAYSARQNTFPAIAFDNMTNYVNNERIQGIGANLDNGGNVVWNGVYIDHCADFAPSLVYAGGVVVAAITVAGYDTILMSFDGSTPQFPSSGAVSSIAYATTPPAGTWTYDGAFALPFDATLSAVQGHGLFGFCQVVSLANQPSFGENWSNNVVANGGAAPSVATVTNLNIFGAGLNNDGLLNQSLGAVPSIYALDAFAPDNLIASLTPQIYFNGSQPWVNHNFVGGDLTVNGLTGDGATKYVDSGFNPSTFANLGAAFYVYNETANGGSDTLSFDGAHGFGGYSKYSDTHALGYNGARVDFGVSPGNGYFSDARTSSTDHRLYFASSVSPFAQFGATDAGGFTAYPNAANYIFVVNQGGPLGGSFSSDTISTVAFKNGFNSTLEQKLFNRVQTLRTAFGGGFR